MEDFNDKVYQLEQQDKYDEIIKLCDNELNINPDDWNPCFHKAMAQFGLKQFPHALLTINKSINAISKIFPKEAEPE